MMSLFSISRQRFFSGAMLLVGMMVPGLSMAAGPLFWDWPAGRKFSEVELQGAAINAAGFIVPGYSTLETGPSGAEVCWRVIPDGDGGFYTGTGHGGEIFHTDKKGRTQPFAQVDGAEVFSLHSLPDGDLLAGCGPDGHLYRIDDRGETELLAQIPGGYVWAIASDEKGETFWLATGSPATLYKFSQKSGLEEMVEFPAQNLLDVMLDKDGSLLVASQGPGLVYRVDPDKPADPWLICETRQDEVRQFLRGPEDRVFFLALNNDDVGTDDSEVGQSGAIPPSLLTLLGGNEEETLEKAALFRLEDGDRITPWWAGNLDLMLVAWHPHWGWIGGGPLSTGDGLSVLHRLTPPASSHTLASWAGGDILDLRVLDDGELLVCQAHPGGVQRLNRQGKEKLLAVSPALDGGSAVQWGRLNWHGNKGRGTPRWSVRCGNRSVPDDSWSPWSESWDEENHTLELPVCRFLQWRVELPRSSGGADDEWQITGVSVSAWQENGRPVVRNFIIETVSDISRGSLVGMSDNVTQVFDSGLKVEFGRKSAVDQRAEPQRAAFTRSVRVMTWRGQDPNSDRLLYDLEYRRLNQQSWRTVIKDSPDQLGSWDTSDVPDGKYQVRVTVSDHLDNPGQLALSSFMEAGPLQVDNTPAEISQFKVKKTADGFQISFRARDKASVLSQAFVRLPDGSQERLDPVDRICDSRTEHFSRNFIWPRSGQQSGDLPWRIRVEVWDLFGNAAVAEGEVH